MQSKQPEVRVQQGNLKLVYDMRGYESYRQLAKDAGVSVGTIGNLMTDNPATRRTTCTSKTAMKIAKALNVKPEQIFFFELCTVTRAECAPSYPAGTLRAA
ncbi:MULTISPECIES: helix-turn-helix transcriptional regulator [unclassified Brevibacterium]|uniref:helix-turn-helix transcriptional regulator n=1 Tax=unclassified Brevibacterium TaxID=2614124 RepID=UPI001E2F0DF4|nr:MULTISPECIES: helix-turn-helix transcriptional regulator [unclassified Brevibacterium]MCD1287291.1 hypothetical protein [Brevibacterium sp. CCUG 69071]MDK8436455.1 helix-turn-helix transcriptional regulator [Brevibacterium sp. H-BE7]